MNIALLGSGNGGQALGQGLLRLGHTVILGTRDTAGEAATKWLQNGSSAKVASSNDAAKAGELVIIGTKGEAVEAHVKILDAGAMAGKVVIDITNPLRFTANGPEQFLGGTDSLGERIQAALPAAHVVKAFNHYNLALISNTPYTSPKGDMFIAGNDASAKAKVTQLIDALGWDTIDLGGIKSSRYLEALATITVIHALGDGNWNIAYKMLGRKV